MDLNKLLIPNSWFWSMSTPESGRSHCGARYTWSLISTIRYKVHWIITRRVEIRIALIQRSFILSSSVFIQQELNCSACSMGFVASWRVAMFSMLMESSCWVDAALVINNHQIYARDSHSNNFSYRKPPEKIRKRLFWTRTMHSSMLRIRESIMFTTSRPRF